MNGNFILRVYPAVPNLVDAEVGDGTRACRYSEPISDFPILLRLIYFFHLSRSYSLVSSLLDSEKKLKVKSLSCSLSRKGLILRDSRSLWIRDFGRQLTLQSDRTWITSITLSFVSWLSIRRCVSKAEKTQPMQVMS